MKKAGKTFELSGGKLKWVYECEECGYRTIRNINDCPACRKEITEHHMEEAMLGII